MLGSELSESKLDWLLNIVKEYIVDVWGIWKNKLYNSDSGPGQQLHSQSSAGDLAVVEGQRNGKWGHSRVRVMKSRLYECRVRDHVIVHLLHT